MCWLAGTAGIGQIIAVSYYVSADFLSSRLRTYQQSTIVLSIAYCWIGSVPLLRKQQIIYVRSDKSRFYHSDRKFKDSLYINMYTNLFLYLRP